MEIVEIVEIVQMIFYGMILGFVSIVLVAFAIRLAKAILDL